MCVSKTIFFTVLVAVLLAAHVSAHGHISTSINGELDVRFTEAGVDKCGVATAEQEAKREAGISDPVFLTRGDEVAFQYQITNGDGAGPLSVQVDPTCQGETFPINIEVTKQVPGVAGNAPDASILPKFFEFRVKVPKDLNCTSGPAKNLCLMQITTPQSFTSCAYIAPVDKARDFNKRTSFQQSNYMFSPNQPQQQQQQQQQQQRQQQMMYFQRQYPQYLMMNSQRNNMQQYGGYNPMQMRQEGPQSYQYGRQQYGNQGGFLYGQVNRYMSSPTSLFRRN